MFSSSSSHFNYTIIYVFRIVQRGGPGHLPEGGPGHPYQKRKTVHGPCVVGELWDYLQFECGEGEALPDNVFCDVMLQVHVHTFPLGTLINNPLFKSFFNQNLHYSITLIFLSLFQGIRQIRISIKLQEVGSQRQYEGWTYLHYAMAGADHVLPLGDVFRAVWGRLRRTNWCLASSILLPPRNSVLRWKRKRPRLVRPSGLINPSGSTTKVYTDQLPIPHDLGVPSDYLPHWESIKKEGTKGGQKSISIYICLFCNHRSQNRTSTVTHTRRHLNVILGCCLCPFTSESTEPLENHIKEAHGGKFLEEQLTDVESVQS